MKSLTENEGNTETCHLGAKLADKGGTRSCLQDPQPKGHLSPVKRTI